MNNQPDKRLDTIGSCIGYGAQIQTTRTPKASYVQTPGAYYPANGLQLAVFSASSADDGGYCPSEIANVFLSKQDTDKLIAILQEHRARMEPEVAPAEVPS